MKTEISRRALIGGGLSLAGGLLAEKHAGALSQGDGHRKPLVVVWSEGTAPKSVYPKDINTAIADGLKPLRGWDVLTVSINDSDQGLPEELLDRTDVLIWWGHERHGDVKNELVRRIVNRVKEDGMGFIATHSAHYAKALQRILEARCSWKHYVDDGSKLDVIVNDKKHPIARGVRDFVVPHTERYGDPFAVPTPEAVIFGGKYSLPDGTSENAQQGMVWTIGNGRVFYFQPGHESYPIYFQEEVRHIFRNAVQWAAPQTRV